MCSLLIIFLHKSLRNGDAFHPESMPSMSALMQIMLELLSSLPRLLTVNKALFSLPHPMEKSLCPEGGILTLGGDAVGMCRGREGGCSVQ